MWKCENNKDNYPLISIILFAYNQENVIKDAVEGILKQTYPNLEVILSDDCSTDRTFDIISELATNYNGTHIVKINKNEVNLGLIGHVNKVCMDIASGSYFVFAAGDDISLPERCEYVWKAIEKNRNVKLIYGSFQMMDQQGNLKNEVTSAQVCSQSADEYIIDDKGAHGAVCTYHRDVFDVFGPIDIATVEDRTLACRAVLLGGNYSCDNVHVYYREGGITDRVDIVPWNIKHHIPFCKQLIKDISQVISINEKKKVRIVSHTNKYLYYLNLEKNILNTSGFYRAQAISVAIIFILFRYPKLSALKSLLILITIYLDGGVFRNKIRGWFK